MYLCSNLIDNIQNKFITFRLPNMLYYNTVLDTELSIY